MPGVMGSAEAVTWGLDLGRPVPSWAVWWKCFTRLCGCPVGRKRDIRSAFLPFGAVGEGWHPVGKAFARRRVLLDGVLGSCYVKKAKWAKTLKNEIEKLTSKHWIYGPQRNINLPTFIKLGLIFQKTEPLLWFHSLATKLTLTCELQALFEGLVPLVTWLLFVGCLFIGKILNSQVGIGIVLKPSSDICV